jgi:hypothetical protein
MEPNRCDSVEHMSIVEESLFFDLECADAQTVFAMGAVFREYSPPTRSECGVGEEATTDSGKLGKCGTVHLRT